MSSPEETKQAADLIERLLTDAAFRGEFRRDPASACEQFGLTELAEELRGGSERQGPVHARAAPVDVQPGGRDHGGRGRGDRRARAGRLRRQADDKRVAGVVNEALSRHSIKAISRAQMPAVDHDGHAVAEDHDGHGSQGARARARREARRQGTRPQRTRPRARSTGTSRRPRARAGCAARGRAAQGRPRCAARRLAGAAARGRCGGAPAPPHEDAPAPAHEDAPAAPAPPHEDAAAPAAHAPEGFHAADSTPPPSGPVTGGRESGVFAAWPRRSPR